MAKDEAKPEAAADDRNQDEQPDEDADVRSRRALIAGVVGGAIGAAALNTAAPAQSFADISFSELLQAVTEGTTEAINTTIAPDIATTTAETIIQRELLQAAFALLRSFGIPSAFIALLNRLIMLLGSAGEDSMGVSGNVPVAMDRSWPLEAVHTSAERRALAIQAALGTRARVMEACTLCATAAEEQGGLAEADAVTLAEMEAAAAAGSLVTVMLGVGSLVATNSQRVSQQIMMLNEQTQLHGDTALREQSARWLQPQVGENDEAPSAAIPIGPANLLSR